MINKKMVDISKGFVVLTFPLDEHIATFLGQSKAGISPGIVSKKERLLWDDPITLSFFVRFIEYIFSLFLNLKLSWSRFLAKIYNKEVEKN